MSTQRIEARRGAAMDVYWQDVPGTFNDPEGHPDGAERAVARATQITEEEMRAAFHAFSSERNTVNRAGKGGVTLGLLPGLRAALDALGFEVVP